MYEFLIALTIILGVVSVALILRYENIQIKNQKNRIFEKYGTPTIMINDKGLLHDKIAYIYEDQELFIVGDDEFHFSEILDFRLNNNPSYKVSTSTSSIIGRGVIGGLLFGGVGSLIGANTANRNVQVTDDANTIYITLNNLSKPVFEYRLSDKKSTQEIMSVLKIIIDRNQQKYSNV